MPANGTTRNDDREFIPYVPASQSLPELTAKAVGLGILLSIVLAGANRFLFEVRRASTSQRFVETPFPQPSENEAFIRAL